MSESVTTVLFDSGYIDDIEQHVAMSTATREGYLLREMQFLFERDDSISCKKTVSYTGVNKHSGKRWFRVDTVYQYTFKIRQLKNGKKYLYIWDIPTNRKSRKSRKHPVDTDPYNLPYNFPPEVIEKVIEFCGKNIGPAPEYLKDDPRELLIHYSKPNMLLARDLYSRHLQKGLSLRTTDPSKIMKSLLGKRYSKKLAGLVRGKANVPGLKNISNYPEEFKNDWIIDLIRREGDLFHYSFLTMYNQSYVVEVIPESIRRKFFLDFLSHPSYVNDIIRYFVNLGIDKETFTFKSYFGRGVGTLSQLHHLLGELERQKRDAEYAKPFELDPIPEKLTNLGFRLPTSRLDLYKWSDHFSNCVSTYSDEVAKKETLVLNWNNEVCLEIRNKKLKQYLGKYNNSLAPEKFWEGVDLLKLNGMIDSEPTEYECWGFQPLPQKELVSQ